MAGSRSFGRRMRLDRLLVERGHFSSRERAREAIEAGLVEVVGRGILKPSTLVGEHEPIIVRDADSAPVSRGYHKLCAAIDEFGIEVAGRMCLDVGISTGGFTECLLERGASRVCGVDVGKGQVDPRLLRDERVCVLEGVNARYLTREMVGFIPDVVTVDVSFISLKVVFPALEAIGGPETSFIMLVKPQFEAGRGKAPKGIVRARDVHETVLRELRDFFAGRGFGVQACASPIRGTKGNIEFFFHVRRGLPVASDSYLSHVVDVAHARQGREGVDI